MKKKTKKEKRVDLAKSALIIVDVQNDFCPGGALPVPDGDKVVEPLNKMIAHARKMGWPIIASRDWHPKQTTHFVTGGCIWPVHCVAGTKGAEFHSELDIIADGVIISKGMGSAENAYSAFEGKTAVNLSLGYFLTKMELDKVFIGGLATDYCVKATVLDALKLGFKVYLLKDACRAVNIKPNDGKKAIAEMKKIGAIITTVKEVLGR